MDDFPSFEAWLADPRNNMAGDPVWRLTAFKRAMYSADISWVDVCALARRPATAGIASQLYRALGSIGANLSEGYARSSGRDRVVEHRQASLAHVVRLLTTMIPRERRRNL